VDYFTKAHEQASTSYVTLSLKIQTIALGNNKKYGQEYGCIFRGNLCKAPNKDLYYLNSSIDWFIIAFLRFQLFTVVRSFNYVYLKLISSHWITIG